MNKEKILLPLDIQFFGRKKNALTKHYVADIPENDKEPDYLRLAKWISDVSDDSDEDVEDEAFYDKLNCRFVG